MSLVGLTKRTPVADTASVANERTNNWSILPLEISIKLHVPAKSFLFLSYKIPIVRLNYCKDVQ